MSDQPNSLESNLLAYKAGELPKLYRSQKLARRIAKYWLKPVVRQHRCVLYDAGDCKAAWRRLRRGEMPPPLNG